MMNKSRDMGTVQQFHQKMQSAASQIRHNASVDGSRSVSPTHSPSHVRKMKTYFSSLKNVIKQKPIVHKKSPVRSKPQQIR